MVRWLALLLPSLARRASAQLSHFRSVLALLVGLWTAELVLRDINAISGHDGETRQTLARCRCSWGSGIERSLCADLGDRYGGPNAGDGAERFERSSWAQYRDGNVVGAGEWVWHGSSLDGGEEVTCDGRALGLESSWAGDVGVDAAVVLWSADLWLPHELSTQMQLSDGQSRRPHWYGLRIHDDKVVVVVLVQVPNTGGVAGS